MVTEYNILIYRFSTVIPIPQGECWRWEMNLDLLQADYCLGRGPERSTAVSRVVLPPDFKSPIIRAAQNDQGFGDGEFEAESA
jgi:hypothetical protein